MKRFLKSFRHGQRGFTLIELIIVIAILGILAAVLVPNLAGFIGTGKVAAYNTEVANVETAALAYYADHNGIWPSTSTELYNALDPDNSYISALPGFLYGFDTWGKVLITDNTSYSADEPNIIWDVANHQWGVQ